MAETLTADVAIIGGGIHGCSAALHLRLRGASVVLLESGLCGAQASGVNFGGVRQQGRELEELPLARRSRALWSRMKELIDHDGEFVQSGHLRMACTEAEMATLEKWANGARDYGLHSELIGRNAVKDRYPWMGDRVIGASLLAEDGHANPRIVSPLFARAARKAGADIRENTKVTAATSTAEGFTVETATGGTVRSKYLLNASCACASDVAPRVGEHVPEAPPPPWRGRPRPRCARRAPPKPHPAQWACTCPAPRSRRPAACPTRGAPASAAPTRACPAGPPLCCSRCCSRC